MFESIGEIFRQAAPWVSLGANLLSTVKSFQAAGEVEEAGAFNRRVFEDEAAAVWRAYGDRASIMRHEQRLFSAEQGTAYAKAGVTLQGSPMEVLADIVYRQELDQRALYSEATAEFKSRLNKGAMAEWEAFQQGSAIRSKALSNITTTLMSQDIRYPWRAADTERVVQSAAPAESRRTFSPL